MTDKNENKILNIIRYAPPFFIILVTLIVALFINLEHKKAIQEEKKNIEAQFIKEERLRINSIANRVHNFLVNKEKTTTQKLKEEIKLHVNNAYEVVKAIYEQNKDTKSMAEIEVLVKEALRNVRFLDGRGYFFIYEIDGKNILNAGFSKIEGKNLWNYQDAKGTFLLQEMKKFLKTKDEVFYDWYWFKPGDKKTQYKKVGFFKKFEELNWFIGTGEYLDDFTNELKEEALSHISKLRYKNDGYVFVFDDKGTILNTKHKDIIGLNSYKVDVLKAFANEVDNLKLEGKTEGLISYKLYKSVNDKNPKEKISYIKSFEKWGWIVGSGFNLEDVNETIHQRQKLLEEKYDGYMNKLVITNFALLIILLILSTVISRYLEKIFISYNENIKEKSDTLVKAHKIAKMGDWELDIETMSAHWSDAVLDILEIKKRPERIGPEYLKTLIHKDDWSCFEESMQSTIEHGTEHRCSYRVQTPSGYKWIDCRGQIDRKNKRIIGTIQDISDVKKIQLEKEQKERLLYQQSKMAAMGEMIGNIAHQWRQPLSTISVAATGVKLQKEMNIISDNDIMKTMDSINNSAQYLSQTIEDFRTFFDSKDGKAKICKIDSLVSKAIKLMESQISINNIQIIKNIDDLEINTLENEFIQVLLNILNNARDALHDIEDISKRKLILITAYKKDTEVVIEILDNANGIDKEIIDRIFEPYFTTKHKAQGTGIGLYMSQDIITKLLNGKISVENKEYEFDNNNYTGACFTITLKV